MEERVKKPATERSLRFLKWIKENAEWWDIICTAEHESMNPQMMANLIEVLEREGFYEIIFVMLKVHRNEYFMSCFKSDMLLDFIISKWFNERDNVIKKIISNLK